MLELKSPNIQARLAICKDKLTKWQLFYALTAHGDERMLAINGKECWLQAISREDGSGSSFNLLVRHNGNDYTVWCRTKD